MEQFTLGRTINRFRGDTVPDVIVVNRPIVGMAFRLTISSIENPPGQVPTVEEILQMPGNIVDVVNGEIHFRPLLTEAKALEPGEYYFDFQLVLPRPGFDQDIKTFEKGFYNIVEDITKQDT